MRKSTRVILMFSLASIFAGMSLSAMAQQPPPKKPVQKVAPIQPKRSGMSGNSAVGLKQTNTLQRTNQGRLQPTNHTGVQQTSHSGSAPGVKSSSAATQKHVVVGAKGYRFGSRGVRRDIRTFNGREHAAWQRGRWHHERRFGRDGYWWAVNGAWYWYAQPVDGPPNYVSDVEMVDDVADVPPPAMVDYPAPPPAPPPSEVLGGAVGDALIGGILGGALTGRSGGAAAGALIGGATGAAIGAEAERRHGYYFWQGNCYYRYPSGDYAPVAPGYCS
jgi:hypothetical protein